MREVESYQDMYYIYINSIAKSYFFLNIRLSCPGLKPIDNSHDPDHPSPELR